MSEQKVKLVQFKIVRLDVSIAPQEIQSQIEAAISCSAHEPKDTADPTTMVKAEYTLKDPSGELLHIECTAEMIFEFAPIPENRMEVLQEYSKAVIPEELMKRITAILHEMGHKLTFNQ